MIMQLSTLMRPARMMDCDAIAQLYSMASDGVTDYVWHTLQDDYPELTPLEIGALRYANPNNIFGYTNCTLAERAGEIVGMMVTFPIEESSSDTSPDTSSDTSIPAASAPPIPVSEQPDVMAPYALEKPGTWYICALAVFPQHRGQGIGSEFLHLARQQARISGYEELSLLCFEQNVGARRLYERHGFTTIDRAAVVPHELIHYTGDILLMTAPAEPYQHVRTR